MNKFSRAIGLEPCPRCGAAPGAGCAARDGRALSTCHNERLRALRESDGLPAALAAETAATVNALAWPEAGGPLAARLGSPHVVENARFGVAFGPRGRTVMFSVRPRGDAVFKDVPLGTVEREYLRLWAATEFLDWARSASGNPPEPPRPCPHGRKLAECDACYVAGDLAYDAAREKRG